jgi:hypothetical protein
MPKFTVKLASVDEFHFESWMLITCGHVKGRTHVVPDLRNPSAFSRV